MCGFRSAIVCEGFWGFFFPQDPGLLSEIYTIEMAGIYQPGGITLSAELLSHFRISCSVLRFTLRGLIYDARGEKPCVSC